MYSTVAYLNSNDGSSILAFGEKDRVVIDYKGDLNAYSSFLARNEGEHKFGYLSYDLKEQLHGLKSENTDHAKFPLLFFWVPEYVVRMDHENFEFIQGDKSAESLDFVNTILEEETDCNFHHYQFDFQPRISKEEYLNTIVKLKNHLQKGDIYEINFCQEFFAENVEINYLFDAYFKLNHLTHAPQSAFLKFDQYTILCGSPERYIRKQDNRLITQPIKGTAPRGKNSEEDVLNKKHLSEDPKERSENVMIVDLVRNDLSIVALKDTVQVEELCGIYTYDTVHQMISTVSCEIAEDTEFLDILKATFPMGSMTGAPKVRAMELIEEYESFKRGVYSGSIGYIQPNGNFDFNVVIRTLLYNANEKYLSCAVGSAITIGSDPEQEFEECMVKVKRIMDGMNE
jgi:para-aminobenzoate synthetase component 1